MTSFGNIVQLRPCIAIYANDTTRERINNIPEKSHIIIIIINIQGQMMSRMRVLIIPMNNELFRITSNHLVTVALTIF